MAASVSAALRGRGFGPSDEEVVLQALHLAMTPRTTLIPDDHHPAFLHPGRSILIILHDVGEAPGPDALALATLLESRDQEFRVPTADVARLLNETIARRLQELPGPGDTSLAEELVSLERGAALAVLAEQLDHLRHMHLRQEMAVDPVSVYQEVAEVWGPFAQRIDPRLGVRFAHWLRTFRKRLPKGAVPADVP